MGGEDTSRLITPRDRRPYGPVQPPGYASPERERRPYSEANFTRGRPSGGIYERERRPYAYDLSPGGPNSQSESGARIAEDLLFVILHAAAVAAMVDVFMVIMAVMATVVMATAAETILESVTSRW